jgi:hypothetical protein
MGCFVDKIKWYTFTRTGGSMLGVHCRGAGHSPQEGELAAGPQKAFVSLPE